jgi:hypothetical protein
MTGDVSDTPKQQQESKPTSENEKSKCTADSAADEMATKSVGGEELRRIISCVGGRGGGIDEASEACRQSADRRCGRRHCHHRCRKHKRRRRHGQRPDDARNAAGEDSAENGAEKVILFFRENVDEVI